MVVGLVLVLFSAPLCAIADGLGPHGSFERDAPEHMKAFRRLASPLLDFSDWESVYHFWEIPLGVGLLLALVPGWLRLRALPPGGARVAAGVAWGAAALFAASTVLEGLALGDVLTNVGVGGTFLMAPVALLGAPVAGGWALWRGVVSRRAVAGWVLVSVPALVLLVVLVVPHIPGAPSVALALAWGAFGAWGVRQDASRARMASA